MMNRVTLEGRLTKDPELRYTGNGVAVAQFTLAVNRDYTNQNGDRECDFINIVVWRRPAENAANFLKKGSLASVDGRLQTRNYEGTDGKRVYVTEVVAEHVYFLDSKERNENSSNSQQRQQTQRQYQEQQNPYSKNSNSPVDDDPFKDNGLPIDIDDDDLPF